MIRHGLFRLVSFLGRAISYVGRIVRAFALTMDPDKSGLGAVIGSTQYNMVTAPDEPYYLEQYWCVLSEHLPSLQEGSLVLDLGCGQGRLSLRLASLFPNSKILGCDLSDQAIVAATTFAEEREIKNASFVTQSISEFLATTTPSSVDLIIFTEVTFFYANWRSDLPSILRSLKSGGVLVLSSRTQYFDGLCLVKHGMWENVEMLLGARNGRIFNSSVEYTWQTSCEIRNILSEAGFELADIRGIGVCSGILGDPLADVCIPSELSDAERNSLMKLEIELGRGVIDGGRYMLAIARKL